MHLGGVDEERQRVLASHRASAFTLPKVIQSLLRMPKSQTDKFKGINPCILPFVNMCIQTSERRLSRPPSLRRPVGTVGKV